MIVSRLDRRPRRLPARASRTGPRTIAFQALSTGASQRLAALNAPPDALPAERLAPLNARS